MGPLPGREPEDHRHRRRRSTTRTTRTTSPTPWPTAPSNGCTASGPRTPTSPSSSTTRPVAATPRTTSPRSGPTSTRARSTKAGTDSARRSSPARRSSASYPPTPSSRPATTAFPAWDDVPENLQTFYARQMEVYAGYSENADHNVGRVIDAIDELGELDNTLILWIWGDNGASMEGTITGSFNELTMQNGIPLTDEMQLQLSELYGGLDQWGAAVMDPHYGAAWAWAGNTPFQWGKQVGSHLGGTRNPLVVHWPDGVSDDAAGLRSQFAHVIDVAPTILDIAGIPAPAASTGSTRSRCTGPPSPRRSPTPRPPSTGLGSTSRPSATERCTRTAGGSRSRPTASRGCSPLRRSRPTRPGVWDPDADPAELYYLPDDFTQAHDLAAEHPDKVEELKALFWAGGRALQGPAPAGPAVDLLRDAPAHPGGDDLRVPRRRAERAAGHDPQDLQPLLLDHRRARRSRPAGRRA